MKDSSQVYVSPVIPVAKLYKPKFEIVNVYVEQEDNKWYLYLVNDDERKFKYRLDFYENN